MSATIWFGMGELGVHGKKHGLGSFVKNRLHLGRLKNSMNKYQDQEKFGEAGEKEEMQKKMHFLFLFCCFALKYSLDIFVPR